MTRLDQLAACAADRHGIVVLRNSVDQIITVLRAAEELARINEDTNWIPFMYKEDGCIDVEATRQFGTALRSLRAALAPFREELKP
jgi:hypothetical protein